MKRMVLIPEEKLIRYEKQLNDQPPTNEQAGGSIFPIHYPGGNYPGHDYLYNYPGSMIGRGEDEESMSIEMIVRSIPKSMKKRAEALLAHLKERGDVITWDDMGQVLIPSARPASRIRHDLEVQPESCPLVGWTIRKTNRSGKVSDVQGYWGSHAVLVRTERSTARH